MTECDHDVGAVLDRAEQVGRRERRVDHQREAVGVSDVGDRFDVHHLDARGCRASRRRTAWCSARIAAAKALGSRGSTNVVVMPKRGSVRFIMLYEPPYRFFDATMWSPALSSDGHGEVQRGRAACRADRADAALERGDALLEHGDRGVRDPAVDVARRFEVEQRRRLVGVGERVRRREVDRYGPGTGGRVGPLAGVQTQRVESQEVGFHHEATLSTQLFRGEPRRPDSRTSHLRWRRRSGLDVDRPEQRAGVW